MSTAVTITAPSVKHILLDSLVVMKIVKHVDSELHAGISEVYYFNLISSLTCNLQVSGDACAGVLTGLVFLEDSRLEITNCFPTVRNEPVMDDDANVKLAHASDSNIFSIIGRSTIRRAKATRDA